MAIVKRLVKGSALTHAELDGNFTDLEAADAAIEGRLDDLEDTLWAHGIENHDSTLTALSLSSGVSTKLLNNSSGAVTNLTRKVPGRGTIGIPQLTSSTGMTLVSSWAILFMSALT